MSGNRPEQAAPVTPGQAAFEAWEAILIEPPAARMKWENLTGDEDAEAYRAAWEAAAQAAIATVRLPTLMVNIDGDVSEEALAQLRRKLADAVNDLDVRKPGSERVAEGNDLRRELAAEQMANVTWRSQNDYFRELIAEILDSFCLPGTASGLLEICVLVSRVDEWRARAGIDTPAVVTAGTGRPDEETQP